MMRSTVLGAVGAIALQATAAVNVIPMPNKVIEREGSFVCDRKGLVSRIVFAKDEAVPEEGYRLLVDKDGIKVFSSDEAGRFYAIETLKQLATPSGEGQVSVPAVEIEDAPRYKWRGLHWDDCRHFFGKEAVMKTLDVMAAHKLNVLHWHLTEDQGWRTEIKKYPDLTVKGSVRPGSPKQAVLKTPGVEGWEFNNIPYGPFYYTQEDIKEIVAYARERHITIIPEIELPGHALAAISAYPELGCTGEQFEPWWRWGVSEHIFCGGNDKVIKFLEDVLDEVCALFPGPIVHIGGDEAPKSMWRKCPKCQARIRELGLKGEEGLQGWMTDHFTKYLAKKCKRAVGWDEVLEGEPGKETIIMSWRGPNGGIKAANRGNDAVMTPIDPCYLDQTQGLKDDPYEYINYGLNITLERTYGFNPVAGIPENEQKHILGGQGNNWSEYTFNPSELEWKVWPRMSAISECLWTRAENKSWESFKSRMIPWRSRLIKDYRVNCAPVE